MATDCSLPSWVKEKEGDLSFEKVYERLAQEGQIQTKLPSKIGSENPLTYGFQGVTKETNCLLQQLQGRAQGTANRIFGKLVRIDKNGDGVVEGTEFSNHVYQKTRGDDPELYEDDIPPLARELWKFSILYTLATTKSAITDVGPPSEPSPPETPRPPMRVPETEVTGRVPSSWFERNKWTVFGIGALIGALIANGLLILRFPHGYLLFRRPIGRALGLLKGTPAGRPPTVPQTRLAAPKAKPAPTPAPREATVRTAAPPPPSGTPRPQTPKPSAGESRPTLKLDTADVEPVVPTAPRGAQAAAPKAPPPIPAEARPLRKRLSGFFSRKKPPAPTPNGGFVRPTPAEARPQVVTVVGSHKRWRSKEGKLVTKVIPRDELAALRGAEQVHKPAAAVKKGGVTGLIRVATSREGTVVEGHIVKPFLPWSRNKLKFTKNEWIGEEKGFFLDLAETLEGQGGYHDGNVLAKGVHRTLVGWTKEYEELQALRELPILVRSTPPTLTSFDAAFLKGLRLDIARDDSDLIRTRLWSALEQQTANQKPIWALIEKLFLSV